jgi:peptide/nickel transport system permease protein
MSPTSSSPSSDGWRRSRSFGRAIGILRRLGLLALVVWLAATVNFIIPRLAERNPVAERLSQMAAQGGSLSGIEEMVRSYEARFGLDRPLWRQYLSYLGDLAQFDLGYSISNYPVRVSDQIALAMPWTIALLGTATLIAFAAGTLLGALAGWSKGPRWSRLTLPAFMVLSAIPFYLVGLVCVYVFAFNLEWFPTGGGHTIGVELTWSFASAADVLRHAALPALSILVASIGFWALAMRSMMVTVEGEDYVLFAEAKGLRSWRVFWFYGVRNALLPQVTTLALAFGKIVTGAVLVEMVFGYPGLGNLLFESVKLNDYFTIYGCVIVLVLTIAVSTLVLDLVLPFIDPRTGMRAA